MTVHESRPHAQNGVPRLAEQPLDARCAPTVSVLRATTTGPVEHDCTIETYSPVFEDGEAAPQPSLVLVHPPEYEVVEDAAAERVRFESDGSTVRAQVPVPEGASYFGLGEHAGPLQRNDRRHLLWNTDAWRYGEPSAALYQSHPWVLVLRPDGSTLGILADTPSRGSVAIAPDGVELAFERDPFDVHLIEGSSPEQVLGALAALVGPIELPPLWALGYHQCRWSYNDADEVRGVARRLRAERVPCDALWLDIDYMDRFRVFTWNKKRFPDPEGLIEDLEETGVHTVAIVDPGVAAAEDYTICASGLVGRHFIEDVEGRPLKGRVWPGVCYFPDFTRASTRAWWGGHVRSFLEESGIAGIWNDMNEPSVFRTPNGTLPDDATHRGMGGGSHARFHNLYGQLMAEATLAGFRAAYGERRPFVLTRANHLSGARLAATWTGDNQARWEDLRWAIPMVLNLGLSGQPFSGPDLGGFHGDPSGELFARWFGLGAYLPFCRGHGDKHSCRKEPWSFGEDVLAHVRSALEKRMRLLPTIYTLFEEARRSGVPVCRPLFFADPGDLRLHSIDDAFLLGRDLLVAPIVEEGVDRRTVVFPANPGGWFPFPSRGERALMSEQTVEAPLGVTPVFARAGSIVVEGALRQSTSEADTVRVWHIFLDPEGRAEGRVFEDAGEGHDVSFLERRIQAELSGERLHLRVVDTGTFPAPEKMRRVVVFGAPGLPKPVRRDVSLEKSFTIELS